MRTPRTRAVTVEGVELVVCGHYACALTVRDCIARQCKLGSPRSWQGLHRFDPATFVWKGTTEKQARKMRHVTGRPTCWCESGRCWPGACRLADAGVWRWEKCCERGCKRCRGTGRVPMPPREEGTDEQERSAVA